MRQRIPSGRTILLAMLLAFVGRPAVPSPDGIQDEDTGRARATVEDLQRPPVVIVDPSTLAKQPIEWSRDKKPLGEYPCGMRIHPSFKTNYSKVYGRGKKAKSPKRGQVIEIRYESGDTLRIESKKRKLVWRWNGRRIPTDKTLLPDGLPAEFFRIGTIKLWVDKVDETVTEARLD